MLTLIYLLAIGATFLMVTVGVKIICACFGIAFLWRYVFGAWAILVLLKQFVGGSK